jgi:DNA-directed RNA polymerase subunit M/transcription elongation factor TFIIS
MKCKKCGNDFLPSKGLVSYCSLQCRNSRTWSEEDKKKKSDSAKSSEKVKIANVNIGKLKKQNPTVTTCVKCGGDIISYRRRNNKYHSECWLSSSGGFRENSTKKYSSFYGGYKMDSNSEKQFAMLCDKHNIKWMKNNGEIHFDYIGNDGKNHKYYPDFYLEEFDCWVEIKGKLYAEIDENFNKKISSVPNLKVVYSREIKKFNFGLLVK